MKRYLGYQFKQAVDELVHKIAKEFGVTVRDIEWTQGITTAGINTHGDVYLADVSDDAVLYDIDVQRYVGFAVHEMLHRKYTDFNVTEESEYVKQLHNACEYALIEHTGIDNNLTRKVSGSDPVQIAMIKGLVAGTVNLTLALSLGAKLPSIGLTAAAGVVGFLGYGVSLVLFVLGLRFLGTARTGAYFSTAPFIGALLALAMFGEALTVPLVLAAALMAVGLYLHLVERHDHEHVHEPLEHEHAHVHDDHHQHEHAPGDPSGEPHVHSHRHARMIHGHPHYPDLHHRHGHDPEGTARP